MKLKMAIIGANEFQLPLVQRCKERGIRTLVFAWNNGAIAKKTADVFYNESILNVEEIKDVCKKEKVNGVCSITSELAMMTVSSIAFKLNLTANSFSSARMTANKMLMKNSFIKANIPCAKGQVFKDFINASKYAEELLKTGDVIVKPSDRSGSLAVTHINSLSNFNKCFLNAKNVSIAKTVIIEEYLEGKEFSIESISFKGVSKIIAITEKETSNSPFFVEISHVQPASISFELRNDIEDIVLKGLKSLKITNGISHSELKVVNGEVKIIEIGGRMGGDYIGSHLTKLSTGVNLLDVAIDISLGIFEWNSAIVMENTKVGVTFLMSEQNGVLGSCEKREITENVIIQKALEAKIGDQVFTPTSSCKRFGYIIYKGNKVTKLDAMNHFGLKVIP